jgi:hypothetical protein
MTPIHPAIVAAVAVACVGGRVVLDQVAPAAGEAWQRGVEVATAAAMVAVYLQFSPGDPPRRPWALIMAPMVLVPIARVVSHYGVLVGDVKLAHLLFIVINVLVALAMIGFNRVLGSSELLADRTDGDRWRALAVVGLLSLCAVAALTFNTWEIAERGWPTSPGAWVAATSTLVSTLSDALVCAGGVYLVWLVRPMLGGSLARPYLLLAIGAGVFLIVDFLLAAAGATIQTELTFATVTAQAAKWLGCLAYALTGLGAAAQAWLLRSASRRAVSARKGRRLHLSEY